jgi:hypothetical protein
VRTGDVNCSDLQGVEDLLTGILSDLKDGAMNAGRRTEITVIAWERDSGPAIRATEWLRRR